MACGGVFCLVATCDVPEAEQYEPDGFIGVDLGIENIATASTGCLAAGRGLGRYRAGQLALRAKLQKKSVKRRLKPRARKEARQAANSNHIISTTIVTEAERTGRGLSCEELRGICNRVRLRKPVRVALCSWACAQPAPRRRAPRAATSTSATVSTRGSSSAGGARSSTTQTAMLPTAWPPAARTCGTRGVNHASTEESALAATWALLLSGCEGRNGSGVAGSG